jgi:NAD(P)-dependent dehydrogenase (short-subunit alcohol dehydrogenase family)
VELTDQIVLIAGGASGLGAAVARHCARRGAKVAILDIDDAGSGLAEVLGGLFVRADITREADVNSALDQIEAHFGIARILVNCAGIAPHALTLRQEGPHDVELFRRVLEINVLGAFIISSRFAARLRKAEIVDEERGVVINTGSVAGFEGQAGQVAYASSKAAVAGMTLPLARDLAPNAIRVMTIAPGVFDTPMLKDLPSANRYDLGSQAPHPARLGRPEEFALLVESIIANPMLNGDVVRLDGALRLGPY